MADLEVSVIPRRHGKNHAYRIGYLAGWNNALREAEKAIAQLETGKTEDICEGHEQAYRAVAALRAIVEGK